MLSFLVGNAIVLIRTGQYFRMCVKHICFTYISYPFVLIRTRSYWLATAIQSACDSNFLLAGVGILCMWPFFG